MLAEPRDPSRSMGAAGRRGDDLPLPRSCSIRPYMAVLDEKHPLPAPGSEFEGVCSTEFGMSTKVSADVWEFRADLHHPPASPLFNALWM